MSEAAWLCQLAEAGLLKANFVPPKPIRDLRQLTRYRKTQIAERQREAQRLHKALEDPSIKLDCVASDLLGVSGRAMLDALVSGTTDPEVLADLAKGRLRQKLPALREALEGRFDDLHALLIGAILAHLDFLDEQIDRLSDAIEERVAPYLCRDAPVKCGVRVDVDCSVADATLTVRWSAGGGALSPTGRPGGPSAKRLTGAGAAL